MSDGYYKAEYKLTKKYYEADKQIRTEVNKKDKYSSSFLTRMVITIKDIFKNLSESNKTYAKTLPRQQGLQKQTYFTLRNNLKHASNDLNKRIADTVNKYNNKPEAVDKIKRDIEEDFKQNGVTQVTYSNGSKHSLSDYVRTATYSLRTETRNIQSLKNAVDLGTDYVYLLPHNGSCPICSSLGDRVYCISGKDKDYPPVFGTLFKSNYKNIHPNCRCVVQPYFKHLKTSHELKRDREQSVRAYHPTVEQNRRYQQANSNGRRLLNEAKEYEILKATLKERFPYKTLGAFRRAKRSNTENYIKLRRLNNEIKRRG